MENTHTHTHTHTHTIPKHILKKRENPPRERERESDCVGNLDWMGEMTSNLYRIKYGEEESKYKKDKRMKEL